MNADNVTAIFSVADLCPEGHDPRTWKPNGYNAAAYLAIRRVGKGEWTGYGYSDRDGWLTEALTADLLTIGSVSGVTADEPTVADLRALVAARTWRTSRPAAPVPTVDAAELGAAIRTRYPLTAEDLRTDPQFASLAYDAAHAGRTYTTALLQWERKEVVVEAVRWFAARVAEEQAEQERERKERERAERRQANRERPTRDAVEAAYAKCGYRICTQGHVVNVVIGREAPRAVSNTFRGERYSNRCIFRKTTSAHRLYVRPDYLKRIAAVGLTHWNGDLVLDAEPAGYATDGRRVFTLRCVRQGAGTQLVNYDVTVATHPVTGATEYKGKVLTRKQVARSLGLRPDAPDAALIDWAEEVTA